MKISETTKAKSIQMNADDLLGGGITVKITDVKGTGDEKQPIAVHFTGDNGKPFMPCKTQRRVLLVKWGDETDDYIGRSVTLYLDPTVKYAGKAVGGVAISHMSNMEDDKPMMLTTARGQKTLVKIEHLQVKTPEEAEQEKIARANVFASQAKTEIEEFTDNGQFVAWTEKNQSSIEAMKKYPDAYKVLIAAVTVATKRLTKDANNGKGE
jgi:hypothetical protein